MALYWKPTALRIQASCSAYVGVDRELTTFSINQIITNTRTLDDLVCENAVAYNGVGVSYFFVGPKALQSSTVDEFYTPSLLVEFLLTSDSGGGRLCIIDTSQYYSINGTLLFGNHIIPVTFFNDDDPSEEIFGSGSLSIISERPFA
jgi:hypothetical protein